MGCHTPPVQHLKNRWAHFIATHGPDEKILVIAHSGGAIHVLNALESSPESVRQRIIVIGIAPAAIIPKKLCYDSRNYKSYFDVVSYLDVPGLVHLNELEHLWPDKKAKWFDHEFLSPTFKPILQGHITKYLENPRERL